MWKYILLGLAAVVAIVLVAAATRPDEFRVTRSGTVAAPAGAVFEQVNTLKNWDAWSPWAKLDPNVRQTFAGPAAGEGASFAWAGNSKVGEGKMTIVESKPSELVRMTLEFLKPFPGTSTTEFKFAPQGEATTVTWTMSGQRNLIEKAFSLFVNCDQMIGGDFEKGLAQLKAVTEAAAKQK